MPDIASLVVRVTGDEKNAKDALNAVDKQVKEAGGSGSGGWKSMLSNALSFGAAQLGVASIGQAFSLVKNTLTDFISSGMEANRMDSILAQGLKSTHDASGQTVQSLDALSQSLMSHTGISDDAVKSGEQMLLTFTGIGKQAFPAATQAVADMATRLNSGAIPSAQQMSQVALQLGKALNDPATGLTMLRREGVTFTAQQQEQIKAMVKAGDTAGAQSIMLKELQKEFGGSAAAAGHANGGMAILTASMDDAKQQIGVALVPAVSTLTATFAPLIVSLAQKLTPIITHLSAYLKTHSGILVALAAVVGTVVVGAFVAWAAATIAATWPILAVVAGVALLTAAFIHFQPQIHAVMSWLGDKLKPVIGAVKFDFALFGKGIQAVTGFMGDLFKKIGDLLGQLGKLKDAAGHALDGLKNIPGIGGLLPHLASGGFTPGGPFIGAEDGPELLVKPGVYAAPKGSRVYSASDTAAMLYGRGAPLTGGASAGTAAGAPSSGGMVGDTFILQLDGRVLAQSTVKHLPGVVRLTTGARSF